MDFNVLGIKITSCEWGNDLVIRGMRSYDRPVLTFFDATFIEGIKNAKGKEILCVELLEKGLYKIQYRDDKNDTILTAERYERIINNQLIRTQFVGGMQYKQKAKKNYQLCPYCSFNFLSLCDFLCGSKIEN